MRKFINKTLFFTLPFFISYCIVLYGYKINDGDLLRVGYIFDSSNYRTLFKKEINDKKIYYNKISDIDTSKKQEFDYFIFGDSFSERKPLNAYSYINYLAKQKNHKVLFYDRSLSSNPIQSLISLINGDILDKINIKYVILQSAEREFINRNNVNFNQKINREDLTRLIAKKGKAQQAKSEKYSHNFFSSATVKFPIFNILYMFTDHPYSSGTYKVAIKEKLFTNKNNDLLFYKEDIKALHINNNYENISKLNNNLNRISDMLNEKGIKLIVLPSADKYDAYWEYIKNKDIYIKPLFFEIMDSLPKRYLYLDSKSVLKKEIKKEKDIYFYDDTHWSPKGMNIIANKIINMTK